VGGYSLARLLIHPVRAAAEGGAPTWFEPVVYLLPVLAAVYWLARPRLEPRRIHSLGAA
jgi:hypothetical protein